MELFLEFLWRYPVVFIVGGLLCVIAELIIVKTKITPARILVIFLLTGVFLEVIGVFKYLKEFAGAGVTVPIMGFGSSLAKGAIEAVKQKGFLGIFSGGLSATSIGIAATVVFSYIAALIFRPHVK